MRLLGLFETFTTLRAAWCKFITIPPSYSKKPQSYTKLYTSLSSKTLVYCEIIVEGCILREAAGDNEQISFKNISVSVSYRLSGCGSLPIAAMAHAVHIAMELKPASLPSRFLL